jgi:AAA domain
MGQHYIIGATSVTASAGGVGKSTLSLLDGVSLRVGRNLLSGETLEKCRRVWIWNAEDDIDEMERRLIGICIHYGINRADLVDWLFLDSGYDLPLDLAHGNGKGPVMQDKLIELIAERVTRRGIEVVSLDPLVALHSMSEGDNPGHAKLIRTISTKVAKPSNCAVDINAHTRKPGVGQDTMTIDDVRGAGSIIYSARSGRILHGMTLGEAQKYGIEADDRFSYYRLERAKANMAKRGTICWVHMVEVPIPNSPDGSYGDTVAVPTLWTPPDAMEGITETVANAIAGEIAKGEYKRDVRSGASWAGRLVGLRCGIDVGTKSGKERAKTILETLIKKGVLAVEIQIDENRNAREYVVPGVLRAPR